MTFRNIGNLPGGQPSPRYYPNGISQASLSANQVSRIVGVPVKTGQTIKGESRINYMPYQKKVIEYQDRQYIERVPIKRKVIQYEQRRVFEQIPRQVVTTDYYAVQNIKQYYKQIIPQKKIQMIPIQRKIKKVQYIPVQKQIIHYPQGQNAQVAKGQSRIVLQKQGVTVRPDAQFRPIDPKLIYNYSNQHKFNPVGYVQDGIKRNLSNAPTSVTNYNYQNEGFYTGPSTTYIQQQPQQYTQYQYTQVPQYQQYQINNYPNDNSTIYRTIQDISINPNSTSNIS